MVRRIPRRRSWNDRFSPSNLGRVRFPYTPASSGTGGNPGGGRGFCVCGSPDWIPRGGVGPRQGWYEWVLVGRSLHELRHGRTRAAVPDPRAELEMIVRQYYAGVERVGRGLDLLERSAVDLPELAQLFYVERRRSLVAQLGKYLESRIRMGAVRPLPDVPTAARLILETVVWFARHRHNSPDSAMIGEAAALETTVDFLVSGLLAPPAPATSTKPKRHPHGSQLHVGRNLQ